MRVLEILNKKAILPELHGSSKTEILTELAAVLAEQNTSIRHEALVEVLLEREKLGSTAIGEGIAIPHGKVARVKLSDRGLRAKHGRRGFQLTRRKSHEAIFSARSPGGFFGGAPKSSRPRVPPAPGYRLPRTSARGRKRDGPLSGDLRRRRQILKRQGGRGYAVGHRNDVMTTQKEAAPGRHRHGPLWIRKE